MTIFNSYVCLPEGNQTSFLLAKQNGWGRRFASDLHVVIPKQVRSRLGNRRSTSLEFVVGLLTPNSKHHG